MELTQIKNEFKMAPIEGETDRFKLEMVAEEIINSQAVLKIEAQQRQENMRLQKQVDNMKAAYGSTEKRLLGKGIPKEWVKKVMEDYTERSQMEEIQRRADALKANIADMQKASQEARKFIKLELEKLKRTKKNDKPTVPTEGKK